MVSKVEIWNRALDLLGERITILDATETSANANLCRRTYERVYKAVQRGYPWKCLTSQASLAADASAPAFGYSLQYSVPNDFGRLLQIYRESKFVNQSPWRLQKDKIQTDIEAPLEILYLSYSDKDKNSVILGGSTTEKADIVLESVSLALNDMNMSYVEIVLDAYNPELQHKAMLARYIPSGYFPCAKKVGDMRHDCIIFSRTFEALDLSNVKVTSVYKTFLKEYVKLWEKMYISSAFENEERKK